ncbi:MAG: hypothetical protein HYZ37_18770 [Candidatus Solibacter usitatus]|nr:hypothetical protein [Candidatus Solibacter usitatus]
MRFSLMLLAAPLAFGDVATLSQSQTTTLLTAGKLSVAASMTLSTPTQTFNNFTGSMNVSYRARTTETGNVTITLLASANFSPTTGPNINNGTLTYTCGSATLGSACSGTQTVSTVSQSSIVSVSSSACTGVGSGCSGSNPNTVQLNFTLTNDPQYKTGSYSAQITLTASSI